jgi:hypothetical protein
MNRRVVWVDSLTRRIVCVDCMNRRVVGVDTMTRRFSDKTYSDKMYKYKNV